MSRNPNNPRTAGTSVHVRPVDVSSVRCDWCNRPSVIRFPMPKNLAMFIYACQNHRNLADEVSHPPKPQRRKT